jgi:hypothetical protein
MAGGAPKRSAAELEEEIRLQEKAAKRARKEAKKVGGWTGLEMISGHLTGQGPCGNMSERRVQRNSRVRGVCTGTIVWQ